MSKKVDDDNIITITAELIPVDTEQKSLATISPLESQLVALKSEATTVQITDKASLDRANDLVSRIKKFETGANKTRLEYTKPARELLDKLKSTVDSWISEASVARVQVENKINAEQIRIQKEAEQKRLERVKILQDSGWVIVDGFYACGPHRIMFEQLETADDNLVALWQQQGQQEAAIKAELEAKEKARLEEIERREAQLRKDEAEMEEFRAWKAEQERLKLPVTPVDLPPVNNEAPTAPLWAGEAPQAPAIQFGGFPEQATPPSFPPQQPAFQIPELQNVSIPDSEQDYINTISFNQGIDAVINHFMSTPNKYEKQAWVNLWNELKK